MSHRTGTHHSGTHSHHAGARPHTHDQEDMWKGEDYMLRPGVKETAVVSHDSVVWALTDAGIGNEQLSKMNLLEVGCGPGAVTPHYLATFASVHSIDTSPSMLAALSSSLPLSTHPTLSYSLHALSVESPAKFSELVRGSGTGSLAAKDANEEDVVEGAKPGCPLTTDRFDVIVANLVLHHVDDLEGFMAGVKGLLKQGGWAVFTEFGGAEGAEDKERKDLADRLVAGKTTHSGSVNAPDHFHPSFSPETLADLLSSAGLVDVSIVRRGSMPVFGLDKEGVSCLVARGRLG